MEEQCSLGKLDLPDVEDRQQGALDVYELGVECDTCMMSADEVFNRVDVRIDGDNGWDVEYIEVEVNGGNTGRYNPLESVDDYLTIPFTKT